MTPLPAVRQKRPDAPSALGALDAEGRAEFWASLALRHTQGLGARTCGRLLACFGSAFAAVRQPQRWHEAGVSRDKAASLSTDAWREPAKREWDACRCLDGILLLWTDPRYPRPLRELPDAPVFLYCRGDMSLLSGACLGVVGKRACTARGIRAAAHLAAGVAAAGMTVVSGLAVGIDRAAHLAAVDQPGGTIAVLGAGLDVDYPKGNRDLRYKIERQGLLLTEYAPGTAPEAGHFPVRNRIISGLSLGVLVVEAALQSGSLITARLALEQNRSVYVLPEAGAGPQSASPAALSEGCRSLLEQGALGVTSHEDILRDLGPQLRGLAPERDAPLKKDVSPKQSLPPEQKSAPEQSLFPKQNTLAVEKEKLLPAPPLAPVGGQAEAQAEAQAGSSAKADAKAEAEPESRIVSVLRAQGALSGDALCRELALDPALVSAALIMLEVRGQVKRLADLRYTLP